MTHNLEWRCRCGVWNTASCHMCGSGPDERWASAAELNALRPSKIENPLQDIKDVIWKYGWREGPVSAAEFIDGFIKRGIEAQRKLDGRCLKCGKIDHEDGGCNIDED